MPLNSCEIVGMQIIVRYHKFHNRYVNCFCQDIWCFFKSTIYNEVLNKAMQGVQMLRMGINFWLHHIKEMVMGEN